MIEFRACLKLPLHFVFKDFCIYLKVGIREGRGTGGETEIGSFAPQMATQSVLDQVQTRSQELSNPESPDRWQGPEQWASLYRFS